MSTPVFTAPKLVIEPRVIVADDSAVMRQMISDLLVEAGCKVVAFATNGIEALAACQLHKPDVLTLDLLMPGLDGLGVLDGLARMNLPTKVVVVSSFSTSLVERAVDVLSRGATEVVRKPAAGVSFGEFTRDVTDKVMIAGSAQQNLTWLASTPATASAGTSTNQVRSARIGDPALPPPATRSVISTKVLIIATSTGGPRALGDLAPLLPVPLGAGSVIVQHMPAGFTKSLARRLNGLTRLDVREAESGDELDSAAMLVARAGEHLRFSRKGIAQLSADAAIGGVRPRADLTITDLTAIHGRRIVLAVMTGMGRDGLEGARAVKSAGGIVIAQSERDCTVYGMPRHVIEAGLADHVATLSELPDVIYEAMSAR
ncbi:MAG: response regulator [Thermoleophilia bacterium]|nr:response regulator [Thermoleophilia bacterium]